ncbi:MAG TPA: lysyl oxidase family protein [Longimicrobium sp.]|nr:lysyl oxidase family protein [Longimicrobium sp.]
MTAIAAVCALAACESSRQVLAPSEGAVRRLGVPDLVGTPDLVVDAAKLASSWVVTDEYLSPNLCSVQEGDVPPGDRRLLRFTVETPNRGDADVAIGDPRTHIDPNGDGNYADSDGLYELDGCHGHFHFRNYATYEMLPVAADGTVGASVMARKRGFCMIDTTPFSNVNGQPKERVYYSCGTPTRAGNQGISVGYADTYVKQLGGQYFVLDDPAEPVPPGQYILRITVNPGFAPVSGQPCPVTNAATGLCHNFAESNYANNVGQITLTVPNRTGKTGGTMKTAVDMVDDENRPSN